MWDAPIARLESGIMLDANLWTQKKKILSILSESGILNFLLEKFYMYDKWFYY